MVQIATALMQGGFFVPLRGRGRPRDAFARGAVFEWPLTGDVVIDKHLACDAVIEQPLSRGAAPSWSEAAISFVLTIALYSRDNGYSACAGYRFAE
jgi:hypothetical protein